MRSILLALSLSFSLASATGCVSGQEETTNDTTEAVVADQASTAEIPEELRASPLTAQSCHDPVPYCAPTRTEYSNLRACAAACTTKCTISCGSCACQ